jgi:hypothetical protein
MGSPNDRIAALRADAASEIADAWTNDASATPGPWTYSKKPNHREDYWFYQVHTGGEASEQRFVFWANGSLGEASGFRSKPGHVRDDPEVEADVRFAAAARTGWPKASKLLQRALEEIDDLSRVYEAAHALRHVLDDTIHGDASDDARLQEAEEALCRALDEYHYPSTSPASGAVASREAHRRQCAAWLEGGQACAECVEFDALVISEDIEERSAAKSSR